ncbi:MAG: NUDIX domain-containing protein [Granulosicoccaceae bacterium]
MDTEIIDNNLHELITGIKDNALYPVEKLDAHERNVPHIAISIFVFDGQRLLLQKRAAGKYHSGGLWANTVCSHPRWQETATDCAQRRLNDELGWQVPLQNIGEITYEAQVGALFENEQVHCFSGQFDRSIDTDRFNRDEVSDIRWLTIDEIIKDINCHPNIYTEWFKIYMKQHRELLGLHRNLSSDLVLSD